MAIAIDGMTIRRVEDDIRWVQVEVAHNCHHRGRAMARLSADGIAS